MNKSILHITVFYFLINVTSIYSQLEFDINTKITTDDLHDVEFINDSVGWVYTYGTGKIFQTKDSGESWSLIAQLDKEYFEQIEFIDQNNGVLVGGNKRVYITNDGGKYWKDTSPFDKNESEAILIYGLYYEKEHIYISCYTPKNKSSKNFFSKNNGKSWTLIENTMNGMFLQMVKREKFYSSGKNIFISEDKGKHWNPILPLYKKSRFSIRALDFEKSRSVAGDFVSGTLFITNDLWKSYSTYKLTTNRIRDLRITENLIIVIGDSNKKKGSLYYSFDTGETWSTKYNIKEDLHRMDETRNSIFIVGKKGLFLRYTKKIIDIYDLTTRN